MDEDTRVIIGLRLKRCHEDLEFARLLLQQAGYRQSINRAYYAAFVLTTAVLAALGIERRKHSSVESAFSQYLVKPGLIEPEYAGIYRRARRWREDADYDDFSEFTHQEAQSILDEVERFVARLEHYLHEAGALGEPNAETNQTQGG